MSSETINLLLGSLRELQDKLQDVEGEARRLGDVRTSLTSAARGLAETGEQLRSTAVSLREGAATMRDLDMAATLRRIAEIESALEARSSAIEKAIDRDMAELGESIKAQLERRLAEIGPQLGQGVAAELAERFDGVVRNQTQSSDRVVATMTDGLGKIRESCGAWGESHAKDLTRIEEGIREDRKEGTAAIQSTVSEVESRLRAELGKAQQAQASSFRSLFLIVLAAAIMALLAAVAASISIFI